MTEFFQSQSVVLLAIFGLFVLALAGLLLWHRRRKKLAKGPYIESSDIQKTFDPSRSEVLLEVTKNLREGILIVGRDMTIASYNDQAQNIISRLNGSSERRRLSEAVRDLSVHEAFEKALTVGTFSEVKLENFGPERKAFDLRVAPLEIGGGRQAIGIFYDITELERLEKVRREFLSNVSHELRTPLTSIIAFVETLEDGALEDVDHNRQFLNVIRKNAHRMHRLIDDILELSSIEAGKIAVEPRDIQLFPLVREVSVNLAAKAGDKQVTIKNEISPDTRVRADAFRLEQMLTNLLDNAVKFNREKGEVSICHERHNGSDLIHVTDTGEGISEEHLPRLFERFYRTDKARSRDLGGTGLGLAIVKHLARLHGGEVTVVSEAEKGSVFTIELPR
ncbi:MAG TPA: ATP-binding protein [Pyrinomonadaceae bacterium]|jgi:two-component system phosphate regulon sensor histidine kinase PhoR|nr:ATP-binding protein [Pyrinomonadaceae bacterium]